MEPAQGRTIKWDQIGHTKMPLSWRAEANISSLTEEIGIFPKKSKLESNEDGKQIAIINKLLWLSSEWILQ